MHYVEKELNQYEKYINEGDEAECRSLWISVILQAILDAKGKYGNSLTQRQAIAWLQAKAEDRSEFAIVCGLAGIDFEKALTRCRELIEKDEIAVDFRKMRREKTENRNVANGRRYIRRIRKNEQLRAATKKSHSNISIIFAANENPLRHDNDNDKQKG